MHAAGTSASRHADVSVDLSACRSRFEAAMRKVGFGPFAQVRATVDEGENRTFAARCHNVMYADYSWVARLPVFIQRLADH
jgi:hypothetical protein